MEITLCDIIRVIRRFRNETEYGRALFMVEMTFHIEGPKPAMMHARRIAAAYANLRLCRMAAQEEADARATELLVMA